jgi:hypothetical protein
VRARPRRARRREVRRPQLAGRGTRRAGPGARHAPRAGGGGGRRPARPDPRADPRASAPAPHRLRPPLRTVWDRDPKGLVTLDPAANNVVAVDAANRLQPAPVFHFDGVFGQGATQAEVYARWGGPRLVNARACGAARARMRMRGRAHVMAGRGPAHAPASLQLRSWWRRRGHHPPRPSLPAS